MTWAWNWNALWTAGAMSLVLSLAFDVPLGYRVALYPICFVLLGLRTKARNDGDPEELTGLPEGGQRRPRQRVR